MSPKMQLHVIVMPAGKYEEKLVQKLAATLAEGQHAIAIVDAPLLRAASVQTFWATAKV
jgi:hypothetical protein